MQSAAGLRARPAAGRRDPVPAGITDLRARAVSGRAAPCLVGRCGARCFGADFVAGEPTRETRRQGSRAVATCDLHTHLIPGVDDGPETPTEAQRAVEALTAAGVDRAVATPHLDASTLNREEDRRERIAAFDRGWERLTESASGRFGVADLHRGAEVRLDEPLPEELDPRVRLAGTRYVLVEFAAFRLPQYAGRQLGEIAGAGYRPVLAHAERFVGIRARMGEVEDWRGQGVRLQVNAGSLVGQYGPRIQATAWELLRRGWADVVASDYHGRNTVRLGAAREAVVGRDGREPWQVLTELNPSRILEDRETVPVPPLSRDRGWWERLTAAFRPW